MPPSGDTASRPQSCAAPGTLRFNTDHGTLEFIGDTIGWEHIQRRESQYLGGGTGSKCWNWNSWCYFLVVLLSGISNTNMNFIILQYQL